MSKMSDNINVYGNLNIDILGDLTLPFANHIFDIDEVLAFFDAYHSTWGNLLIHLVASPVIPWTLLVWASSLGGRTLALGLAGLFLVYYCSLHLAYGVSRAAVRKPATHLTAFPLSSSLPHSFPLRPCSFS